jgi:hypothetical protein
LRRFKRRPSSSADLKTRSTMCEQYPCKERMQEAGDKSPTAV